MKISRPIVVTGSGRNGSSMFVKIFGAHPGLAWLSPICSKMPSRPWLNRMLVQATEYPVIGAYLRHRTGPQECFPFWEHCCTGFRETLRDLVAADVTDKNRARIPKILSQMLTDKKNRLLLKITGWPRIGFLREIFPDAKFIHLLRDGRAVANSCLNVPWWRGWRGPEHWRWGPLSPAHREEWEKHDRSFVALAGIQWNMLMDAMELAKGQLAPENLLEIKFEDVCADPNRLFKQVVEFCELEWSPVFENRLKSYRLKLTNHKWKQELSKDQQRILNDVVREHLVRYGYDASVDSAAT